MQTFADAKVLAQEKSLDDLTEAPAETAAG